MFSTHPNIHCPNNTNSSQKESGEEKKHLIFIMYMLFSKYKVQYKNTLLFAWLVVYLNHIIISNNNELY